MQQGSTTLSFLNNTLGVDALSDDVSPSINGQTAPLVVPTGAVTGFSETFATFTLTIAPGPAAVIAITFRRVSVSGSCVVQ